MLDKFICRVFNKRFMRLLCRWRLLCKSKGLRGREWRRWKWKIWLDLNVTKNRGEHGITLMKVRMSFNINWCNFILKFLLLCLLGIWRNPIRKGFTSQCITCLGPKTIYSTPSFSSNFFYSIPYFISQVNLCTRIVQICPFFLKAFLKNKTIWILEIIK